MRSPLLLLVLMNSVHAVEIPRRTFFGGGLAGVARMLLPPKIAPVDRFDVAERTYLASRKMQLRTLPYGALDWPCGMRPSTQIGSPHALVDALVDLERQVAADLNVSPAAVARAIPLILRPSALIGFASDDNLVIDGQVNMYDDRLQTAVIDRLRTVDPTFAASIEAVGRALPSRYELLHFLEIEENTDHFRATHVYADPARLALRFFVAPAEPVPMRDLEYQQKVEIFAANYLTPLARLERMRRDLGLMGVSRARDHALDLTATLTAELRDDLKALPGRLLLRSRATSAAALPIETSAPLIEALAPVYARAEIATADVWAALSLVAGHPCDEQLARTTPTDEVAFSVPAAIRSPEHQEDTP